jgi:hypothetical protein
MELLSEEFSLTDTVARALHKQQIASPELRRFLQVRFPVSTPCEDFATLWSLDAYALTHVHMIQQATEEIRLAVARDLARLRLQEAWGIENAGMTFAAKMSLLAETVEAQQLYSLFAAEEARHFHAIQAFLGPVVEPCQDFFVTWLRDMMCHTERRPLLLLIQVVLEGWGLEHYVSLMRTCQSPRLKAILGDILADEAIHHGSGLALFRESEMTQLEYRQAFERLREFLEMVRVGPVAILECLESHLGLTAQQRQRILTEMCAEAETTRKLKLLKNLMQRAQAFRLLEQLDAQRCFEL